MSTVPPPHAVLNITEEMPDTVRYPPPFSGRLINVDDIKLEQVWQPLWDTFLFPPTPVETIFFFQNPAGRSYFDTNMQTAGCLPWPKRYYPCELSIRLGTPGALGFVKEHRDRLCRAAEGLADNSAVASFRIGEKTEFQCPLWGMYNPNMLEWKAPLLSKPYIPPVQNFMVTLSIPKWMLPPGTAVRCMLNGYLLREIA